MAIGYRFDDFEPSIGSKVSAFRTLNSLMNFVRNQGGTYSKYWEIRGQIIKDEGGPDGLTIKVEGYKQIPI